jgi:hypothetical protein
VGGGGNPDTDHADAGDAADVERTLVTAYRP